MRLWSFLACFQWCTSEPSKTPPPKTLQTLPHTWIPSVKMLEPKGDIFIQTTTLLYKSSFIYHRNAFCPTFPYLGFFFFLPFSLRKGKLEGSLFCGWFTTVFSSFCICISNTQLPFENLSWFSHLPSAILIISTSIPLYPSTKLSSHYSHPIAAGCLFLSWGHEIKEGFMQEAASTWSLRIDRSFPGKDEDIANTRQALDNVLRIEDTWFHTFLSSVLWNSY